MLVPRLGSQPHLRQHPGLARLGTAGSGASPRRPPRACLPVACPAPATHGESGARRRSRSICAWRFPRHAWAAAPAWLPLARLQRHLLRRAAAVIVATLRPNLGRGSRRSEASAWHCHGCTAAGCAFPVGQQVFRGRLWRQQHPGELGLVCHGSSVGQAGCGWGASHQHHHHHAQPLHKGVGARKLDATPRQASFLSLASTTGAGGPRAGSQAAGHVYRRHGLRRTAPPGVGAGRQLG